MDNKIRIDYSDLRDPKVDKILAEEEDQTAARMGVGSDLAEEGKVSLIHKSWLNLMIAGLIGAFIGWALVEPYFSDETLEAIPGLMLFLLVGGLTGLMIGSMEGVLARNFRRALRGGIIGFGIGFGGGLVSSIVAGIIFQIVAISGVSVFGEQAATDPGSSIGLLLFLIIARSLAWAVAGMTVGLGPGIALKSKKLVWRGFIGGMIGGAIGGLLFDPINLIASRGTLQTGAEWSRGIGFSVIGASAGLMIGLVEMLTMEAWLLMTAGPLKGKQFIIYNNPTIIGSSPKSHVYLFKDSLIEPTHAAIHTIRDGYEIEDKDSSSGTLINGRKIKRQRLRSGDEVRIGETRFIYSEKERKSTST